MKEVMLITAMLYSLLMLLASGIIAIKFVRAGNNWASLGALLYMVVSWIAILSIGGLMMVMKGR